MLAEAMHGDGKPHRRRPDALLRQGRDGGLGIARKGGRVLRGRGQFGRDLAGGERGHAVRRNERAVGAQERGADRLDRASLVGAVLREF